MKQTTIKFEQPENKVPETNESDFYMTEDLLQLVCEYGIFNRSAIEVLTDIDDMKSDIFKLRHTSTTAYIDNYIDNKLKEKYGSKDSTEMPGFNEDLIRIEKEANNSLDNEYEKIERDIICATERMDNVLLQYEDSHETRVVTDSDDFLDSIYNFYVIDCNITKEKIMNRQIFYSIIKKYT